MTTFTVKDGVLSAPDLFTKSIAPQKQYVLGIDVGGTSIGASLFEVKNGVISEHAVVTLPQLGKGGKGLETSKGRAAHAKQVSNIIKLGAEVTALIGDGGGKLVAVGIGSPGRFDDNGQIKPGTNNAIGTTPNEMDGVNLKEDYLNALAEIKLPKIPEVIVHNDGSAMLAGMVDAIKYGKAAELKDDTGAALDAEALNGKRVALFGIGTGIGHAIIQTEKPGQPQQFVTDGHASKLWIKVDAADMELLHEKLKAANERIEKSDDKLIIVEREGEVRAEDLFRAPVLNALAGRTPEEIKDKNFPAAEDFNRACEFGGKYMARTIAAIKSAQNEDVEPANGWSDADKAEAAKTDIYLVGGDFGRKFGDKLIAGAKKAITEDAALADAVGDVRMVQYTGETVAERAAATMIPKELFKSGHAKAAA